MRLLQLSVLKQRITELIIYCFRGFQISSVCAFLPKRQLEWNNINPNKIRFFPRKRKTNSRIVTRYYGIRDHAKAWKGPVSGITSHNAWVRDQQYFSWNYGSGIKFFRVQGSKFSLFLGSDVKILGKSMGSVTKKYISLRPRNRVLYYHENVKWFGRIKQILTISYLKIFGPILLLLLFSE